MSSSVGTNTQAQLGVGATSAEVTDWFQQQLLAALADPLFNLPKVFLTYITDYVATSGLNVPIGQVIGFAQFAAQPATSITAGGSTASTTYTTTFGATAGPSLANLPDGQYVLLFGCRMGGNTAYMNLKLNGVNPVNDDDSASASLAAGSVSIARVVVKTLNTGGANTIDAVYRTDSATTASGALRWLVALKFANA